MGPTTKLVRYETLTKFRNYNAFLFLALFKKIFKIHTQERKVTTYTSTSLKSPFFFLFVTMAHEVTCTVFRKINRKLGRAKVAYQEGYMEVRRILRKARGHATQTCSLVWVSFHSSKTELDQTFPAINRKEYTKRHFRSGTVKSITPPRSSSPGWPEPGLHRHHCQDACRLGLARGWESQLCFAPVTALVKSYLLLHNG